MYQVPQKKSHWKWLGLGCSKLPQLSCEAAESYHVHPSSSVSVFVLDYVSVVNSGGIRCGFVIM